VKLLGTAKLTYTVDSAEYFARYNLGYDVPFERYTNGIVTYTQISSASRGAVRPTWELLYNHYAVQKRLDAPWTEAYLNKSLDFFGGYEGGAGSWGEGSGHYDGLGWGSLLYRADSPSDVSRREPHRHRRSDAEQINSPSIL
jgi:hypothetical protein